MVQVKHDPSRLPHHPSPHNRSAKRVIRRLACLAWRMRSRLLAKVVLPTPVGRGDEGHAGEADGIAGTIHIGSNRVRDCPMRLRWINPEKQRYYSVQLVADLFGDWTLVTCWGGLHSRLGGLRVNGVGSYEAGLEQIAQIAKRRPQRGYAAVDAADGDLVS